MEGIINFYINLLALFGDRDRLKYFHNLIAFNAKNPVLAWWCLPNLPENNIDNCDLKDDLKDDNKYN